MPISHDLRLSLRRLARTPGITAIAVATLALGLAASSAIFALTWAVVLRSLPVPRPHELVQYTLSNGVASPGVSYPLYTLLRDREQTSSGLLAFRDLPNTAVRRGPRQSLETVELLTPNAFSVLELRPALGRTLAEDDTALLSDGYARQNFGSPAAALGKFIAVGGRAFTVTGVLPPAFQGLTANLPTAVYLPLTLKFAAALLGSDIATEARDLHYSVLGRLKPSANLANARVEALSLEPSLRRDADPTGRYLGRYFSDFRLQVQPGNSGNSWLRATYQAPLLALELLVGLLLVLCAVNTGLVMLARVSGRSHEYAVAAALGAPRFHAVRQVFLESLLLALPALVLGQLLGWAGAHVLVSMLAGNWDSAADPGSLSTRPGGVALAVNAALCLLVALAAAVVPALRAASQAPALDLKAGRSIAARRSGAWPIALQTAVSLLLVSAAFLFGATLVHLLTAHSGFRFENTAVAEIDLSPLARSDSENVATFTRLQQSLRAQPGVEAAGFSFILPLSGHYVVTSAFAIDDRGQTRLEPTVYSPTVNPDFFAAAGTAILAGKPTPTAIAHDKGPQSCALSRSLAAVFFPGEDPVGRLIYFTRQDGAAQLTPDPARSCRVSAVVEDARYVSLRQPAPPMIYTLYAVDSPDGFSGSSINLVLRAGTEPLALLALHRAFAQTLPPGAIIRLETFRQRAAADLGRERILLSLSGAFAVLALLLSGLGLYGLLMRSVAQRRREIGIRLALGASRRGVLLALARPLSFAAGAGVVLGIPAALALSRLLMHMSPTAAASPMPGIALAAGVVFAVAALATFSPARRAARTDPAEALRAE